MNTLKTALAQKNRIQIYPGEQYVGSGDIILSTLLGSCVAACLYDPVNGVVGMNHFLLANHRYPRNMSLIAAEAGRYGVHAMEMLINEMLKNGAKRQHLKAKAFGGGNILKPSKNASNFFCVGSINALFIQEFLENERIPLVASDLGGDLGRIIHFFSNDYTVHARKVQKTMTSNVINQERNFWRKSVKENQAKRPEVVLWD